MLLTEEEIPDSYFDDFVKTFDKLYLLNHQG
jgi:hypothetical protein